MAIHDGSDAIVNVISYNARSTSLNINYWLCDYNVSSVVRIHWITIGC